MSSSRIIRESDYTSGAVAWQAPQVIAAADEPPPVDPEQVRREAYEAGFQQGQTEGFATGSARINAQIESLERVLALFTKPMANLDHRVEEEIVLLVRKLCERLLRREMKTETSHIAGVVREGLAALPVAQGEVILRLNGEDAAAVEEYLGADDSARWRIEIDPLVSRGGCLVFSADSQIDSRVETRLARLISSMFEDDRAQPRETEDNDE